MVHLKLTYFTLQKAVMHSSSAHFTRENNPYPDKNWTAGVQHLYLTRKIWSPLNTDVQAGHNKAWDVKNTFYSDLPKENKASAMYIRTMFVANAIIRKDGMRTIIPCQTKNGASAADGNGVTFPHMWEFRGNIWWLIPRQSFFFFFIGDKLVHTNFSLQAGICLQWPSELRWQ